MRAYIDTVGGRPFNEECSTAWKGFEELGVECVPFASNEVLEKSKREDVVVGGILVTGHALAIRGVHPPAIDYPESLYGFLGREVRKCSVGEIDQNALPLFVKPAKEKELPGIVASRIEDLFNYRTLGDEYEVWCSEPVEFVSEWRLFLRNGSFLDARNYFGDGDMQPDWNVVDRILEAYTDAPAGCAVDVGVARDGRTLLVEVNDGYALGCYGANPVAYALLLAARWAELVGVDDGLRSLSLGELALVGNMDEALSIIRKG